MCTALPCVRLFSAFVEQVSRERRRSRRGSANTLPLNPFVPAREFARPRFSRRNACRPGPEALARKSLPDGGDCRRQDSALISTTPHANRTAVLLMMCSPRYFPLQLHVNESLVVSASRLPVDENFLA